MSAIAGAIRMHAAARTDGHHLVRRMLALMAHRGAATELFRSAGDATVLGERRSAAAAPGDAATDVHAVLDGEIYNAQPLRHALAFAGQAPANGRDAEIAGRGCRLYGTDFLHQLHGRFALALQINDNDLLLARDRLGEKPLYYMFRDGLLLFASEIKALVATLPGRRQIDRLALHQYLALGFVPPPRTMFEGITKLGAGEAIIVRPGEGAHRRSWWRLAADERRFGRIRSLSPEQHLLNLRTLLESAVADRLIPTGRLAVILDERAESRAVAVLAARLLGRRLEAVRVVAGGVAPVPEIGCRDVRLGQRDVAAMLPDLVHQLDEPIADPRAVATWLAARCLAENGASAALTGDGAAELLLAATVDDTAMATLLQRLRRRLTGSAAMPSEVLPPSAADFFGPADIQQLLVAPPETQDLGLVIEPPWMPPEGIDTAAYNELRLAVPERLLMRLDKAASAHALELRLPLLDHQLIDYVIALPPGQRSLDGISLLEQALSKPAPAAATAAADFGADWFDGGLGEIYAAAMVGGRFAGSGILACGASLQLLDDHRRGRGRHHRRLWALMVLAEWCDMFWVDVPAAPLNDDLPGRAAG